MQLKIQAEEHGIARHDHVTGVILQSALVSELPQHRRLRSRGESLAVRHDDVLKGLRPLGRFRSNFGGNRNREHQREERVRQSGYES